MWTCGHAPIRGHICTTVGNPMHDTTIPQAVGPMLDQVNALVNSLPKNKIGQLLDESFQAFNGAGYDLGRCPIRPRESRADANGIVDRARAFTEDAGRCWTRRRGRPTRSGGGRTAWPGFRDVLVEDDSRVRTIAGERSRGVGRGVAAFPADQADVAGVTCQPDHRSGRSALLTIPRWSSC